MEEIMFNLVTVNFVVLFFCADFLLVKHLIDWIRRREY